ncbi:hypothetical protein [Sphingobacterium sp. SGR-19]|uniref:hypothetical protein n=1 Tax=Sphingobacterium sp. SGR-19 TaxID=2710886 RepID=UPI0013EA0E03|nr:hypothetical protein [Sphingobacterium sp. SGR-19]NGM65129.1 hypothetical protein [Sphingobacterium sp. SGR-19]
MKQNKKIKYQVPTIEVVEIEMENGIAADSTAGELQIDDWQNGGSEADNVDF